MAGYGLAGSYLSITDLADRHNVPLAKLVPAGIDGGLVAVVVLDLVLAWMGTPVGWLRQLVRVLSVGTVAANAVAGWPDPVATGLHAAAPLMLLAMIEASRTVLLRRIGRAPGTLREPIPLARWLLAPWRTFLLWRRMALWRITSYRIAVDTELQLRRAVPLLRVRYGAVGLAKHQPTWCGCCAPHRHGRGNRAGVRVAGSRGEITLSMLALAWLAAVKTQATKGEPTQPT